MPGHISDGGRTVQSCGAPTAAVLKSGIIDNILDFAKFKQNQLLKKTDGAKSARVSGIPKLDDANMAGTREAEKCTLILTEGDSAKALAVSGLSVVGRDYFGVFPLRGKVRAARDTEDGVPRPA